MAVLIVDDETTTREALRHLLERLGHGPILEAKHGQDALKTASAAPARIEMIVADWEMPYMDGLELLKEIGRKPELELVPFLLITSDLSDAILETFHAENPRLDHHLLKPFRLKGLADAMNVAARRRAFTRDVLLVVDTAESALLAAVSRVVQAGGTGHWKRAVLATNEEELEAQLTKLGARVGCVLIAPQGISRIDPGWLTSYKKTPLGSATTFTAFSREPLTIRPIRTLCQFYYGMTEGDPAALAGLLRKLSQKLENSWPVDRLLRELRTLGQRGDLKAARKHFTELFKLDDLSSESHVAAAEICEGLGDIEGACRQYRYAIDANPCIPRCHIKLLSLFGEQDAARVAETAVQFCPENADVLAAAAGSWQRVGETVRAREAAEKALAVAPGHKGALEILSRLGGTGA